MGNYQSISKTEDRDNEVICPDSPINPEATTEEVTIQPTIERVKYIYNWKRPASRSFEHSNVRQFKLHPHLSSVKKFSLVDKCPAIYDQGQLGSCVSNGVACLYEFDQMKQGIDVFTPARLFIYYDTRVMEGTVDEDAGSSVIDAIQSVHETGVCDEKMWPYDIKKFKNKPTSDCYIFADNHRTNTYNSVKQSLDQIKQSILNGYPIAFGFTVYQSFESDDVAKTGNMTMPTPDDVVLGGHCVAAVGFDDDRQVIICRNSWGSDWGDKGYFYMPYEYITNEDLASDFWIINSVEEESFVNKIRSMFKAPSYKHSTCSIMMNSIYVD
jgi:C1A family cysteine protease